MWKSGWILRNLLKVFLRGVEIGLQLVKGSPVVPIGQKQLALWLETMHSAEYPHEPIQGFLHLWFWQERSFGQSAFIVHSGLQLGGEP